MLSSILKELLKLLPNSNYIKDHFSDKINESIILIECFCVLEKKIESRINSEDHDNDKIDDYNPTNKTELLKKTFFLVNALKDKLYETINIGHWSKVNLIYRRAFTLITFLDIIFRLLVAANNNATINPKFLDKLLYDLDYGLLMGCPLEDIHENLLSKSIDILTNELLNLKKLTDANFVCAATSTIPTENELINLLNNKRSENELCQIPTLSKPSIFEFQENYFLTKNPCLLLNCINHWPAMEKWKKCNYLGNKAGERLVPIEVGSRYTNDDWSQELIKFKEFFNRQILENIKTDDQDNNTSNKRIEYLAQHNLFDQIPLLKNDICIPEYCCCSNNNGEDDAAAEAKTTTETNDVDIKAWLGPKGTISPMHYDPKHNLLCQIFGHKLIILASPNDTNNLYPHNGSLLVNTSQIDPEHLDLQTFPLANGVQFYQFNLYAGEMVYIPPGWWHYIRSLDKSFSVSFWWN